MLTIRSLGMIFILLLIFDLIGLNNQCFSQNNIGKQEAMQLLKDSGYSFNCDDFVYSACQGKKRIVELYLIAGINPNCKHHNGPTALFDAIYNFKEAEAKDYISIIELLLNNGVDINIKGDYDITPIMIAIQKNRQSLVELLIDKGADLNIRNTLGHTPLMMAAAGKNVNIIKNILDKGVDINQTDKQGRTALMYSLSNSNHDKTKIMIIETLISRGANVNAVDVQGNKVLNLAKDIRLNVDPEVIIILRQAGANAVPQPLGKSKGMSKADSSQKAVEERGETPQQKPSGSPPDFYDYYGTRKREPTKMEVDDARQKIRNATKPIQIKGVIKWESGSSGYKLHISNNYRMAILNQNYDVLKPLENHWAHIEGLVDPNDRFGTNALPHFIFIRHLNAKNYTGNTPPKYPDDE